MESGSYLTSARRCVLVMVFMISVALPSSVWAQAPRAALALLQLGSARLPATHRAMKWQS